MAALNLNDLTGLKDAAASFLIRSDLVDALDLFVRLCEQRIAYGAGAQSPFPSDPVRCRGMEQRDSAVTINSQTLALPDGYLKTRRFTLPTNPITVLTYMPPDAFWQTTAAGQVGTPTIFTIEAGSFVFAPTPAATFTGSHLYWKTLPPLATAGTNWLLQNAPGVYLYGTLLEAAPYIQEDERLRLWHGLYLGAAGGLNEVEGAARATGGLLISRPGIATP